MNKHDLRRNINRTINECCKDGAFRHAVVRVNGKIEYFDEVQMRAMQILVARMNDEEYQDFCNSVVIYNGMTVKSSTDTITILRDGRLNKSFTDGLYSANGELSLQLFMMLPILH